MLLAIDAVVYGLEVRGREVGDEVGADVQQVAGGMGGAGQGLPLTHRDTAVHVCLTSTHGCPESLDGNTVVCGVRENSVDKHSPAVPSGLLGRSLSPPVNPSSRAQRCFQLLGETVAQMPAPGPLKQWVRILSHHPCKPRGPSAWRMTMRLTNPVPVADFLRLYKPSRYVLQVEKAEQGLHFVAVRDESLADPADGTWRPLTVESFTQLTITKIIFCLELASY